MTKGSPEATQGPAVSSSSWSSEETEQGIRNALICFWVIDDICIVFLFSSAKLDSVQTHLYVIFNKKISIRFEGKGQWHWGHSEHYVKVMKSSLSILSRYPKS